MFTLTLIRVILSIETPNGVKKSLTGGNDLNKTTYIAALPKETQEKIKNILIHTGADPEEIEAALNSRLCDLEEVTEIKNIFKGDAKQ